jgi:VWA domain-containing protein
MKTLLPSLAAAAALALLPSSAVAQKNGGKTHIRHIYVSVTDGKGAAVEGLTAADFTVGEAGQPRVVSKAGPATDPMRIALMLDTSDAAAPALTHMRAGAAAFLDALPPEDEVMLITTGRQMRVRVPPTTDRRKLKDTAAGLFTDGAGTVLMDGLLEIDDRFFKKADDRWPVIVLFTSDGTEASTGSREKEFMKWSPQLATRGFTVHALVFKTPKGSGMPEIVAENLTQNTGGRYDVMNTTTALPEKMKALGEKLALDHRNMSHWYALEIQTDGADSAPLDVAVPREGVRLQISNTRR